MNNESRDPRSQGPQAGGQGLVARTQGKKANYLSRVLG